MREITYFNDLLKNMCSDRLKSIYGDNIPAECTQRVEEELKIIEETKRAAEFILYINAVNKEDPYKRKLSGLNRTHSYIMYLCGADFINPIDKGLYDGHIMSVELLRARLRDRSFCYSLSYYGTMDTASRIAAALESQESIDRVIIHFSHIHETNNTVNTYTIIPKDEYKHLYDFDLTHWVFRAVRDPHYDFIDYMANLTNTNPLDVPYTDQKIIDFVLDTTGNNIGKCGILLFEHTQHTYDIIKTLNPKTFFDLLQVTALRLCDDGWNVDIKRHHLNGQKIFATRDDVFDFFVDELKDSKEALIATDCVFSEKTERIQQEYPQYCNRKEFSGVGRLMSRAAVLHFVRIICIEAYYKINYPEAFYYAYFKRMISLDFRTYRTERIITKAINSASITNESDKFFPQLETAAEMYKNGYTWENIRNKFATRHRKNDMECDLDE
ncbi:MAG: hypothetical protein IJ062_04105 [Firmicutes bacterium]|nr:hypothetical protein [Bacillota bacterium]